MQQPEKPKTFKLDVRDIPQDVVYELHKIAAHKGITVSQFLRNEFSRIPDPKAAAHAGRLYCTNMPQGTMDKLTRIARARCGNVADVVREEVSRIVREHGENKR